MAAKRQHLDGVGTSFEAARVYQPICKLGAGFSDEQLARWSELAPSDEAGAEANRVDVGEGLPSHLEPHVWLPPSVVWEVTAASVSVSPTYRAAFGRVAEGKGLALRFPRLVRERLDKRPLDATTAAELADVYTRQTSASTRPT